MPVRDTLKRIGQAAPEIIRGGIVAAANPTRGAVGTAGDIFGAIGAVEEDRMAREERARRRAMQELALRRQAEEDQRQAALNEARINEYKTRAEYNQRRGTQQAEKSVSPSKLQIYKDANEYYKGLGFSDEDAHVEARSIALGTPSPELYNKRTPSTDAAQMNRALEEWRSNPDLQGQYQNFQEYYKSLGISAAKAGTSADVARARAEGTAEGKPIPGRLTPTFEGQRFVIPPMFRGGKKISDAVISDVDQRLTPPPKVTRQGTTSDQRLKRDETISRITNRILKEDASGKPENALRNVQNFYQDDAEVQQYKAEVMARLQKLVQGQSTSKKAEQSIDVMDRAKARREGKASTKLADPLKVR